MRMKKAPWGVLLMRIGGMLCLTLVLANTLTGCVDQRRRVVKPEHATERNDPDWKILKEPNLNPRPDPNQP